MFSILLNVLLSSSLALAAPRPQIVERAVELRRGCGVHISPERFASSERKFQSHRLPPLPTNTSTVIDVHWHVVAANQTIEGGWVPDTQIQKQLEVLNNDYNGTGISWQLVNTTRVISQDWFDKVAPESSEQTAMKQVLRAGNSSALNVYTVGFVSDPSAQGLLGYATFPADYKSNPKDDGVTIRYSTVPDGSAAPFNLGRTLTHEVGHWVGLYHTFQGGCSGDGDAVDDTPPEASAASGCPKNRDTCPGGGTDPVTNFMDYTDDSCMDGFTAGQAARMRAQLRLYRGIQYK
jgi:hypothetical protein